MEMSKENCENCEKEVFALDLELCIVKDTMGNDEVKLWCCDDCRELKTVTRIK